MVDAAPTDAARLRLYAYPTARESGDYVAIMRLFAGSLLAEWSAHDVAERGIDLPLDVLEQRLRYLESNGNLLTSPREVRVTSIAEYQRQPARYTATTLGVRVHRQVEEVLAAAGGAREVPASCWPPSPTGSPNWLPSAPPGSLPPTPASCCRPPPRCSCSTRRSPPPSPTSTPTSARCSPRSDLDDDEWLGFKHLLLDYLETIVEAISRHTVTIRLALTRLEPSLGLLLERLGEADADVEALRAASPGGDGVEQARGRTPARLGRHGRVVRHRW